MITTNKHIGHNIAYYRERSGLTQDELAKIIKKKKGYVIRIEKKRAYPRIAMIARIAAALGISMHELTGENMTLPQF